MLFQPSAVSAQPLLHDRRPIRRSDHITDTLASFHWLKASERVQFKLATIVYRSSTVWLLITGLLIWSLSAMPSRRRLRSSLTDQLDVCQLQCSTVGDRAFAVAGARLCNSLPPDIVACDTLSCFHQELKNQNISIQTVTSINFVLVFLCGPLQFIIRPC